MEKIKELIELKSQRDALVAQIKSLEKELIDLCATNGVKELYDEDGNKALVVHYNETEINTTRKAYDQLRTYKA